MSSVLQNSSALIDASLYRALPEHLAQAGCELPTEFRDHDVCSDGAHVVKKHLLTIELQKYSSGHRIYESGVLRMAMQLRFV